MREKTILIMIFALSAHSVVQVDRDRRPGHYPKNDAHQIINGKNQKNGKEVTQLSVNRGTTHRLLRRSFMNFIKERR